MCHYNTSRSSVPWSQGLVGMSHSWESHENNWFYSFRSFIKCVKIYSHLLVRKCSLYTPPPSPRLLSKLARLYWVWCLGVSCTGFGSSQLRLLAGWKLLTACTAQRTWDSIPANPGQHLRVFLNLFAINLHFGSPWGLDCPVWLTWFFLGLPRMLQSLSRLV